MVEFDESVASAIATKIIYSNPGTQLTIDYLIDVIRWSCQGDDHWYGHHGAFDQYLEKLGKRREVCGNCRCWIVIDPDTELAYCSDACLQEHFGP